RDHRQGRRRLLHPGPAGRRRSVDVGRPVHLRQDHGLAGRHPGARDRHGRGIPAERRDPQLHRVQGCRQHRVAGRRPGH
ncbi:hypothetical protein LTR94_037782, partial [Friedmanniomyces endolithicus]